MRRCEVDGKRYKSSPRSVHQGNPPQTLANSIVSCVEQKRFKGADGGTVHWKELLAFPLTLLSLSWVLFFWPQCETWSVRIELYKVLGQEAGSKFQLAHASYLSNSCLTYENGREAPRMNLSLDVEMSSSRHGTVANVWTHGQVISWFSTPLSTYTGFYPPHPTCLI